MYIEVVQPGFVAEVTIAADSFSAAMFDLVWKNKYTYTMLLILGTNKKLFKKHLNF